MRGWEKAFEDIVGPQRFAEVKRIAAEDDLREKLRLSAARCEPSAYAPGRRVMMHSLDNTRVFKGKILPGHTKPGYETPEDKRRIAWDDDIITTVPVTRLELIEE